MMSIGSLIGRFTRDPADKYFIHEGNVVRDEDGGLCCPWCGYPYDSPSVHIIRTMYDERKWLCVNCGMSGKIQPGIRLLSGPTEDQKV